MVLHGASVFCEVLAVAEEIGGGLGISTETGGFLCALRAEMEETVDYLKLKTWTVLCEARAATEERVNL